VNAEPVYFPSALEFRRWLEANADRETELLVGFHKLGTGRAGLTWPQSVDEALCVGWIDGIRRRVDEDRYTIRFTPRKKASTWSQVNIRRVQELTSQGRMKPAGLAAFALRQAGGAALYSYEQRPVELPEPYARVLARSRKAARFFETQPASYRRTAIWWVVSARQEATRLRRLRQLIEDSARGERIPQFVSSPKPRNAKGNSAV